MPRNKSLLFLLAALIFSSAPSADPIYQTLTVEQAYQAVPHQQTRFDAASALMGYEEKQFLDLFFGLTDLALVERVSIVKTEAHASSGGGNYDEILRRLSELQVPSKLATAHQLVIAAVNEQKAYLERWRSSGAAFDSNDPLVNSSHQKFLQAYNELMRNYPQENAHNKQAFYDHLCTLDFK